MTTTGEQPAAKAETPVTPLGEKSIFDWKFVVLVVGLAFEAGQAHVRLSALEKADAAKEAAIVALQDRVTKLDKETATKSDVKEIATALNNLTLEFAKLNASLGAAGSANRAVYRQPREPNP